MFLKLLGVTILLGGVGTGTYFLVVFIQDLINTNEVLIQEIITNIPVSQDHDVGTTFESPRHFIAHVNPDLKLDTSTCEHKDILAPFTPMKTIVDNLSRLVIKTDTFYKGTRTYNGLKCQTCYKTMPYGANPSLVNQDLIVSPLPFDDYLSRTFDRWNTAVSQLRPGFYDILVITTEYPAVHKISLTPGLKKIVVISDKLKLSNIGAALPSTVLVFKINDFGLEEYPLEFARVLAMSTTKIGYSFCFSNGHLGNMYLETQEKLRLKYPNNIIAIQKNCFLPFFCNSLIIPSGLRISFEVLRHIFNRCAWYTGSIAPIVFLPEYAVYLKEPWKPIVVWNPSPGKKTVDNFMNIITYDKDTSSYHKTAVEFNYDSIAMHLAGHNKLLLTAQQPIILGPAITSEGFSGIHRHDCDAPHKDGNWELRRRGPLSIIKPDNAYKSEVKEDGLRCVVHFGSEHQGVHPDVVSRIREGNDKNIALIESFKIVADTIKARDISCALFTGVSEGYPFNRSLPPFIKHYVIITSKANLEHLKAQINKYDDIIVVIDAPGRAYATLRIALALYVSMHTDCIIYTGNANLTFASPLLLTDLDIPVVSNLDYVAGLAAAGNTRFYRVENKHLEQISAAIYYSCIYGVDENLIGLFEPNWIVVEHELPTVLALFKDNPESKTLVRYLPRDGLFYQKASRWVETEHVIDYTRCLAYNGAFYPHRAPVCTTIGLYGPSGGGKSYINASYYDVLKAKGFQMIKVVIVSDFVVAYIYLKYNYWVVVYEFGGLDADKGLQANLDEGSIVKSWGPSFEKVSFLYYCDCEDKTRTNRKIFLDLVPSFVPVIGFPFHLHTCDIQDERIPLRKKKVFSLFETIPWGNQDQNQVNYINNIKDLFREPVNQPSSSTLSRLENRIDQLADKIKNANNEHNQSALHDIRRELSSLSNIVTSMQTDLDTKIKDQMTQNTTDMRAVTGLVESMISLDGPTRFHDNLAIMLDEAITNVLNEALQTLISTEINSQTTKISQILSEVQGGFNETLDTALNSIQQTLMAQLNVDEWNNNLARVDDILVKIQTSFLATEIGNTMEFRHAVAEAIRRRRISLRTANETESTETEADSIICDSINDVIDARLDPDSTLYTSRVRLQERINALTAEITPRLLFAGDSNRPGYGQIKTISDVAVTSEDPGVPALLVPSIRAEDLLTVTPRADLDIPIESLYHSRQEVLDIIMATPQSQIGPRILASMRMLTGLRNNTLSTLEVRFSNNNTFTTLKTLSTWTHDDWPTLFSGTAFYRVYGDTHISVSRTAFEDCISCNIKELLSNEKLGNLILD